MAIKWLRGGVKLIEHDPWYVRFSPNPGIGFRLTWSKYRVAISFKRGLEIFKMRELVHPDKPNEKIQVWLPVYRRFSSTLKRI